ncbi:hypothetical protein QOZ80_4BG0359850 [Eleusine coracana subsp. coracana]|nr:hypothetical protein QOZ80_4BG0359850 [Eleusine coracana subsp. coracana]
MDLVVGGSGSTVKSLVSKLGSLLAQEYALIRGVRGDIQYINDELCSMQAFLTNLGPRDKDQDAQIQDWAKQIRDIAYDIEDCVDDFAHRFPDDPGGSAIKMWIYEIRTWYPRRGIAGKIGELKKRAEHVGTRRTRYGVRDPRPRQDTGTSAGEAAYLAAENQVSSCQLVGVKEPVGMTDAIRKLELWVKEPKKERRVLSLVGFGGVGKTTIAMALYRRFGGQFEHRAVVTVSQKFDLGTVLQSILSQVMPQVALKEEKGRRPSKIETLENRLKKDLLQHLKGKRYFLLFDDLWTCVRDRKNDILHNVDHLPIKECKALFQETVSESKGSIDDRPDQLDIRKDILDLLTIFGSLDQLSSLSFNFGIVQVLDLQGCKGFKKHHVKAISKMLLVKFLNLRGTDIKELPSKIGRLKYLETLDIRETNVRELPDSIVELEKICNILGGNKHTRETLKLPKEIGKKPMKSLRILSGIEIVGESSAMLDLHEYTALKKLAIYKLNIQEKDPGFKNFVSSIEYLGGCSLQTLSIEDEVSDTINSLDYLSSPPKYLTGLELHGMLTKVPQWIHQLGDLSKLTLSVTVLRTDTLELLSKLSSLFSLTFSFSEAKPAPHLADILHRNKSDSEGEIVVPDEGFEGLKLLRFATPILPLLIFSEKAMPQVQRVEMRFKVLEGVFGMDNLAGLQELHLRVSDKAGKFTKSALAHLAKQARKYAQAPRVVLFQPFYFLFFVGGGWEALGSEQHVREDRECREVELDELDLVHGLIWPCASHGNMTRRMHSRYACAMVIDRETSWERLRTGPRAAASRSYVVFASSPAALTGVEPL